MRVFDVGDSYQDWIDYLTRLDPCAEGIACVRRVGKATIAKGLGSPIKFEDWEQNFARWAIRFAGDTLSDKAYALLIEIACPEPIDAAHVYVHAPNISKTKGEMLKKKFSSRHRPDGRVVLPTYEMQLLSGELIPRSEALRGRFA